VCVCVLEVSVSANDQRILPSADSNSELRFDNDSPLPLRHHDLPSVHADKLFEGYTRGHACHRSPFERPSDSAAQPLQRPSSDDAEPLQHPGNDNTQPLKHPSADNIDCQVLPSTSSDNIDSCQLPLSETASSTSSTINPQLMDGYATARVKCL